MRPFAERRARSAAGNDGRSYGPSRRSLGPNRVHDIEYARASACVSATPLAQSSACAVGSSGPGMHVRRADHQLRKIRGSVVRSGAAPSLPPFTVINMCLAPSTGELARRPLGSPFVADRNPPSFLLSPQNGTYNDLAECLNAMSRGKRSKNSDFGELKIR
jgi:hypothetical protein